MQVGAALGIPIGALAFDVTQAGTKLGDSTDANGRSQPGGTLSGQSYQLSYSKLISETNSNLSAVFHRSSSQNYLDF